MRSREIIYRLHGDLIACSLLAVVAGAFSLMPSGGPDPLRIGFGALAILAIPGYTISSALFPRTGELSALERLTLALGLSIAVIPLILLVLNLSPWGIHAGSMATTLMAFTLAMAGTAAFRRRAARIDGDGRGHTDPSGRKEAALMIALAMATIGGTLAAVAAIRPEPRFTEFYVLGSSGSFGSYPVQLAPGETYTLTFGVGNHEGEDVRYAITTLDNGRPRRLATVYVPDASTEETAVVLTAPRQPGRVRVPFTLLREGRVEPYRSVHLDFEIDADATGSTRR